MSLLGRDVRTAGPALRARVGYLPGDLRLDGRVTAAHHVRLAAQVRRMPDTGDAPLLSSHVLSEVQRLAGRVALIRDGRLALAGSVDDLRARAAQRVEVAFAAPPPRGAFDGLEGVREVDRHGHVVRLAVGGPFDPLLKRLAGFEVVWLDSREADLEDVFLERYGDAG